MDITPNESSNRESLVRCRACLSTERRLFNIHESKLTDAFSHISGTPVYQDHLPQFLCTFCGALLIKCASFREMCLRTQQTLVPELYKQALNTEYIHSIPSHSIYNLTITTLEPQECLDTAPTLPDVDIKVEPNIDIVDIDSIIKNNLKVELEKKEINDDKDKDIIFVKNVESVKKKRKRCTGKKNNTSEDEYDPELNDRDDDSIVSLEDKTDLYIELDDINDDNVYRKINKSKVKKKERKGKKDIAVKNNKKLKVLHKPKEITKRTGAKYPRDPTNDMPLFDFDKFEKAHAVQIVTLSKEEQLEEIASRKKSRNYLESRFRCDDCGKGFDAEAAYNNHLLRHSPSMGQHPCEICSVRFKLKCRRQQHQDLHRLKFLCKECSFVSRTRSQAKRHHAMHAGKTYECQHCGKTFKMSSTYLTHVRRAHAALNVACDVCGETFVGEKGLKLHKKRTHSENMPLRLKCPVCSANFNSLEALNRHTDTAGEHGDLRPCEQCGENCASEEALHRHVGEVHPSELRRCDECGMTFPSAASYDTHHRRKHLQRYKDGRNVARKRRVPRAPPPRGQFVCEQCGRILPVCTVSLLHTSAAVQGRTERSAQAPPPPRPSPPRAVRVRAVRTHTAGVYCLTLTYTCSGTRTGGMSHANVVSPAPRPPAGSSCASSADAYCRCVLSHSYIHLQRYKDGRNVARKRRVPRAPPPRGQFVCEQCGRILPVCTDSLLHTPAAVQGRAECRTQTSCTPRPAPPRAVRVRAVRTHTAGVYCLTLTYTCSGTRTGGMSHANVVYPAPRPPAGSSCASSADAYCRCVLTHSYIHLQRYKDGRNVARKRRVPRAPPPRGQFVCEQCGRILPVCTVSLLHTPAAVQGRAECRTQTSCTPRPAPPRAVRVRAVRTHTAGVYCLTLTYTCSGTRTGGTFSASAASPAPRPPAGSSCASSADAYCRCVLSHSYIHLQRYKDGRNVQRKRRLPRAPPPRGQFVCEQCGRILPNATLLRYHQRTHQDVKPYACTECPKTFALKSSLNFHMRSHTGERPFQCPLCPLAFTVKANLNRHHRTAHLKLHPRIPCSICGRVFTTNSCVRVHINTVHHGQPGPKRDRRKRKKPDSPCTISSLTQ
ncbi:zinc finger protein 628-like [Cydia amplana]|uniref:zinc finger protein 628-like n=2 Tax=Cydia TaxID=82599 RepID=UPI002FE57C06